MNANKPSAAINNILPYFATKAESENVDVVAVDVVAVFALLLVVVPNTALTPGTLLSTVRSADVCESTALASPESEYNDAGIIFLPVNNLTGVFTVAKTASVPFCTIVLNQLIYAV